MSESDGLVFSYILDGGGGDSCLNWDDIKQWKAEQGALWMHLDYASTVTQEWLHNESGLPSFICDALIESETRPRILSTVDGLLFIMRGVNCNPGSDPEDMVSLRIWFDEHRIISMRHRKVMAVDDIKMTVERGQGPDSPGSFLTTIIDRLADRIGDVISDIDDSIDGLEETVLTAESHELRPRLAHMRRQTISMRRYIAPQRDVLSRLQNERIPWLKDTDRIHIREAAERMARFVEDLDSARDRAAITQEELNSRLSEQTNKTIYVLSIVAAIFLPLGLLTGLLGINVGGIPGTENKWAFFIVSSLLIVIATFLYMAFKRMRWL